MKKIYSYFCCIALIFCFLPIRVSADNPTYIIASDGIFMYNTSNSNMYVGFFNSSSEIRGVCFKNSDRYRFLWVSASSFSYKVQEGSQPNVSNQAAFNNEHTSNYYVGATLEWNFVSTPYIIIEWDPSWGNFNNPNYVDAEKAVYYAYGAGSISPEPPAPVLGQLANVGYNTKIAGSGQAAINNLDTVSWNPETDTLGNDISNMSVSVRVVPGKYSASSRQSLAEKLYSDFVLNTLDATVLDTVPAGSGFFSVTWENVIDELALPFATISSIIDQDGTFIKNGWIYQVRLEGDNYEGDWQTVYTATSSGVQNDLTIIQSTTINQTLVNTITEINELNSTTNNWYINETTINMSDYTEPSQGEKPWWAYLLEAIVSLINKIVDGITSIVGAIADLVGDIIDGILGLFTFDSFSIPDFSTHQQTIHDNSGIFGESIDILQTMNETLSNADSTAEPILYYPGIQLEGVQFIPEMTINLNDYVEDLGLTQWHNLAYTCTDILIWSSLIYTIYRKLIGVFKR